jgi:hypothetical protein
MVVIGERLGVGSSLDPFLLFGLVGVRHHWHWEEREQRKQRDLLGDFPLLAILRRQLSCSSLTLREGAHRQDTTSTIFDLNCELLAAGEWMALVPQVAVAPLEGELRHSPQTNVILSFGKINLTAPLRDSPLTVSSIGKICDKIAHISHLLTRFDGQYSPGECLERICEPSEMMSSQRWSGASARSTESECGRGRESSKERVGERWCQNLLKRPESQSSSLVNKEIQGTRHHSEPLCVKRD